MANKEISKELLSAIQKIVSETKGQTLTDDLINELEVVTKPISEFYEITSFQALVFSVYLECGLRDIDVDTEKLIGYYGKNMSVMADINEAVDQLLEKKLVYIRRHDYSSGRKKSYNKTIAAKDKVLDSLMKGDKTLLEITKVNNFYSLLTEVRELLVKRIDGIITTYELGTEVRGILEHHRAFPEVEWLLNIEGLDNYDICLALDLTIEHVEGAEEVDFDKLIKEVFSDVQDRVKYKRKVKENRCPLVLNDIIEFTDSGFSFLNYIRLSDTAMDIFLGGYKDTIKKEFKPKMGNLIYPDKIESEKLYYNPAEREQIETLTTALDDTNYKDLVERMKLQGMKAGFSVLLYGFPGTGKTSSVKQIAKATGRSIYMVEIDKIQSKWVGESEKNLAKVFEEYKYCKKYFNIDPILLFNEADAILGKRFNVNSSVDKTFNALQNILLQELEDFEGIFMATTNLADQLDKAFDRRLLYKVDFQKPEKSISKKILGHAFSYLTEEIIEKINECYTLTGGQISNIRKKLLVKSILTKDLNLEEYVQILCKDEIILNQNNRTPIGFSHKTN
jgi:ATPase family associated with various cellular activities (AAA)